MNRNILRTFFVIGAFLAVAVLVLVFAKDTKEQTTGALSGDVLTVSEPRWDFGEIPMDEGIVRREVTITNNGNSPVTVTKLETSCMCTTAQIIHADGRKSDLKGMVGHGGSAFMSDVIQPREAIVIRVSFDPNAHGPNATGPIARTVMLQTDLTDQAQMRLAFNGDVVKTRSTNRIEALETEHDFGIVKQSAGLQSHAFRLKYNGKEPLEVTALPTSCGCTSAKIDKNILQPGDETTINVIFDPNLHAEPEGRFFKTVSLITNPKLDHSVELKIWAEIDLDLGPQAYKQGGHDDEHEDVSNHSDGRSFHTVTPAILSSWMEDKDFALVDVHIPEQAHIEGTDVFIPYNEIAENLEKLPNDKDAKIVLYCRSGSMSLESADLLTRMGYTNVFHLEGGIQAFREYLDKK